MILIGQYDSPFVRRVGIALRLYDIAFEQWPWSTFGDADRLRPYNPLTRVPTLVLDDDEVLIDSHIIIDYLDSLVPAERRLFPAAEPARRKALKVATLATGMSDKAVSLFYEKRLHNEISDAWAKRCRMQIEAVLQVLEADRAAHTSAYWFGEEIGHADIAIAAGMGFIVEAHPGLMDMARYPALGGHRQRLEALPVFKDIYQAFIAPA